MHAAAVGASADALECISHFVLVSVRVITSKIMKYIKQCYLCVSLLS